MTINSGQQAPKRMSTSLKTALIVIPLALIVIIVGIFVSNQLNKAQVADAPNGSTVEGAVPLIHESSHVLDDAGEGAPELVEFLDFECGSCGSVYPVIEEIRAQYDGQLTYVPRYFITRHANSMNAALAAEAASQQGKFEEMFHILFERQAEWGGHQTSQADLIRTYAEELGLDMGAFDAAVADPATQERVELDHNAGAALGVHGTPSFFLNGKELNLTYVSDLTDAIDEALANQK